MLRELREGEGQRKNYCVELKPVPPLVEVRITQLATASFRDHVADRTNIIIFGRLLRHGPSFAGDCIFFCEAPPGIGWFQTGFCADFPSHFLEDYFLLSVLVPLPQRL